MSRWIAIQTSGGAKGLDTVRDAALDAGLWAYIPRCTITQRPIFAEYVFLETALANARVLELLRERPAVGARIARIAGEVTAAEMRTVDAIVRFAATSAVPIALHGIEPGDVIEITAGPMRGQRAVFSRAEHQRGKAMLVVDISILGRVVAWELAPEAAQRVADIARDRRRQAKRKPTERSTRP